MSYLDYPFYSPYYRSRYYSPYYGSRVYDYSYVSPARSYVYDYPLYHPETRVETTVTTTTLERPVYTPLDYTYRSYYPYSSYYSPYRSYRYYPYALDRPYTTYYLWDQILHFNNFYKWLIFEWKNKLNIMFVNNMSWFFV